MSNPWRDYQHEVRKVIEKDDYNTKTAKDTWNDIAKENNLGPFEFWEANNDVYKRIAYKIRKKYIQDKAVKKIVRSRKIAKKKNDFNTFLNKNPKNPEDAAKEYKKQMTEQKINEKKINKEFEASDQKKREYKVNKRDRFKVDLKQSLLQLLKYQGF